MSELAILGGNPVCTEAWPRWPVATARDRELIEEVLSSELWGGTGLGPKITELNEKFAQYCGVRYGAAVANGTISMVLCLKAWGVGPGDDVIIPPFTFAATAIAVHDVGATAVYVDIDPSTLNIDPDQLEQAITGRTRAIIPVHLAGHPCDMDPINQIAQRHGLKILEDAAQAHGAIYKGRMTGSLADAASFSFQQSKNMQSGEGGIVVSDDLELIDLIHYSLGKFGRGTRENYSGHIHYRHGTNACYTEIQAAIALAQFEQLEQQTQLRVANARRLYDLMDPLPGIVTYPWQSYCDRHGHHLLMYRVEQDALHGASRSQFLAALNAEGVPSSSLYPMALYKQPMYEADPTLACRAHPCPVTEQATRDVCFLEHNLLLTEGDRIEQLVEAIAKVCRNADQLTRVEIDDREQMGSAVLRKAKLKATL